MAVLAWEAKAVFKIPSNLVDLFLCSVDNFCHAIVSGHRLASMISAAKSKLACEAQADNCMRYSANPDTSDSLEDHLDTSGVGAGPNHFSDLAKTSFEPFSESPRHPPGNVMEGFPNWPPTSDSLGIAPKNSGSIRPWRPSCSPNTWCKVLIWLASKLRLSCLPTGKSDLGRNAEDHT